MSPNSDSKVSFNKFQNGSSSSRLTIFIASSLKLQSHFRKSVSIRREKLQLSSMGDHDLVSKPATDAASLPGRQQSFTSAPSPLSGLFNIFRQQWQSFVGHGNIKPAFLIHPATDHDFLVVEAIFTSIIDDVINSL